MHVNDSAKPIYVEMYLMIDILYILLEQKYVDNLTL